MECLADLATAQQEAGLTSFAARSGALLPVGLVPPEKPVNAHFRITLNSWGWGRSPLAYLGSHGCVLHGLWLVGLVSASHAAPLAGVLSSDRTQRTWRVWVPVLMWQYYLQATPSDSWALIPIHTIFSFDIVLTQFVRYSCCQSLSWSCSCCMLMILCRIPICSILVHIKFYSSFWHRCWIPPQVQVLLQTLWPQVSFSKLLFVFLKIYCFTWTAR